MLGVKCGKRINIALTTDDNYILQTIVTVYSIVKNTISCEEIYIFILCAPSLPEWARIRLKAIKKFDHRVSVFFKVIDDKKICKASTTAHIPIASYYRLYMCDLIEEERCLFVDGDMIIETDLYEVFNMNLDDVYAAVVKDMGVHMNIEEYGEYADYLGIESMHDYFNAGFVLFNLNKIRKDGLKEKLINAISADYKYMDQDILNKYFYGKTKFLSLRYDFFTEYINNNDCNLIKQFYGEDVKEIKNNIAVYHYTGYFKPWICLRLEVNELWWKYAKKILSKEEIKMLHDNAENLDEQSDWSYICRKTKDFSKIAIWGYSDIGKEVADHLKKEINKDIFFIDNAKEKIGQAYHTMCVKSIDHIDVEDAEICFIVSSQNAYLQIKKQLMSLNVEESRIFRYVYKDESYYERLKKEKVRSEYL